MCLFLALACAPETHDSTAQPTGPADWSECVDYGSGTVTCNEVCADEGRLCAAGQCGAGYTAERYVLPQCASSSTGLDIGCDDSFEVSTSSGNSAACCCW